MEEINKEYKRKSKKQTAELQELVSEASLEKNYRILGKVTGTCYTNISQTTHCQKFYLNDLKSLRVLPNSTDIYLFNVMLLVPFPSKETHKTSGGDILSGTLND